MKIKRFSIYYDRRGLKNSPVSKGSLMTDLVVGKVEQLSTVNRFGDKPIPHMTDKNNFLEWLEGYKDGIAKKLESAITENKNNLALMLTAKLTVCNEIELAYLKLK